MIRKIGIVVLGFILIFLAGLEEANGKEFFLLAGTYSNVMHVYKFNSDNGKLLPASNFQIQNAQFLAITGNGKFVYTANDKSNGKEGEISALSFDGRDGTLHLINAVSTGSEPCCFVQNSADNKWIVAGNYRLGTICVCKTNPDGSIKEVIQTIDHRTNAPAGILPHVHCTIFSPDGKYLYATDLGQNKLFCYPFSQTSRTPVVENEVSVMEYPDGYGPRHLAFHPNGKYLYLIAEKSGHLLSYKYNEGKLVELQDQLSDSTNHDGKGGSADIHITPDGKFLYVSHRLKANDIVGYKIGSSGRLTELFHQSTHGIQPRNFAIDPTGSFLLVANVDSGNIVVFKISRETGILTPTGEEVKLDKPFCLKIVAKNE